MDDSHSNIPTSGDPRAFVDPAIIEALTARGLPVPDPLPWRRRFDRLRSTRPDVGHLRLVHDAYRECCTVEFFQTWRGVVAGWHDFGFSRDADENAALIDDSLLRAFDQITSEVFRLRPGRNLGRRTIAPANPAAYLRVCIRNARTDVLRSIRAGEGRMSREDWLFRSTARVAIFDDDMVLARVADLLTRWLWWPDSGSGPDVFPLDAWIEDLGIDVGDRERRSSARHEVRRLADEAIDRINRFYDAADDGLGRTVADRNVNIPLAERARAHAFDDSRAR